MAIIKGGTAKVQKGDTLSAIAKAAGTTVSAIAKANNIANVNLIKPGQVFTIPKAGGTGNVSSNVPAYTTYTDDIANYNWQTGSSEPTPPPGNATEDAAAIAARIAAEQEAARKIELAAAQAAAIAAANTGNNAAIKALQDQITTLLSTQKTAQELAQQQATLAAQTETDTAAEARRSAVAVLTERFEEYGLGSLINKIKDLAIEGATEATISLALRETEEYKERFKANEERIKKGLRVLTPAEYLRVEDGYRQVLRSYGLKQFDTDNYVSQFIANDISPAEFSNRVVTAVQRVQNADPAVSRQLRDYYGIGQSDLVAYALDPTNQLQKIERQVAAAEIGVAAARQGLQAGVSVAEQLAAQGVTEAEAQKGYATIADILPTSEKLSDIYGTTLDAYGQSEAEQEVFNSLASAQRKRQRLTAREVAAFSGSSGTNRTSLTTSSVGQF
jgi:murein DD-endopeptidase MepM/ murein hydrolase activator NlpD